MIYRPRNHQEEVFGGDKAVPTVTIGFGGVAYHQFSAHVLRQAGAADPKINRNYLFLHFVSLNKKRMKDDESK